MDLYYHHWLYRVASSPGEYRQLKLAKGGFLVNSRFSKTYNRLAHYMATYHSYAFIKDENTNEQENNKEEPEVRSKEDEDKDVGANLVKSMDKAVAELKNEVDELKVEDQAKLGNKVEELKVEAQAKLKNEVDELKMEAELKNKVEVDAVESESSSC